jgi:Zn-dependent peptidase ImmA (M78 family)/DNA-binding XRE family transcriptional regulator
MPVFNPNRLKFARKRRGLTIKALSAKLGITTRTYSDYEKDGADPRVSIIDLLCDILSFPNKFFYLDDVTFLDTTAVSFRSLARLSASDRDMALHAGQIALEFSTWLDNKFELPTADLPDLRDYHPEVAADALRNEWSIGELPIKNMIHLLEAKGVMIFSLDEDTQDMDAYSFWMNSNPFVFFNTKKSVERGRFDAAHELGHLVLHKHGEPSGKEVESEANRFASALLMPEGSILSHVPKFPTLKWILSAKTFWLVSASALVRRLKDLEVITEWQYRTFTIEMSKNGYMRTEPNALTQRETSKLMPIIFNALKKEGITKQHICDDLGYFSKDIDAFVLDSTSHLRVVK